MAAKKFPKLENKYILAPMADITNKEFRMLCRKYGCGLAYTPQLSAIAIIKNNKKAIEALDRTREKGPLGLQLFGRNPETLLAAAKKAENNFDIIDLNLGCPSKKIVSQGYGSALLKEKDKVKEIIQCLVKGLKKPVTVKMRSGFKEMEALELVKVIEIAGASAITIHARTQEQGYSGKADWSIIKQAKEAVNIPVIGNGDVTGPESAHRLIEGTNCDYVMIGRAAMTNPWIFKQLLHYDNTGEILEQTGKEKFGQYYEWLALNKKAPSIQEKKLIAGHFSKGIKNGKEFRERLMKAKTGEKLDEECERYYRFL